MAKNKKNKPSNADDKPKGIDLEITVMPKEKKYEMEVTKPGSKEALLMIDTRHNLVHNAEAGYATFANIINVRKLVSEDGEKPKCLGVMKVDNAQEFTLGINFDIFENLSPLAQQELLKEQVLRIPYGHMSSRSKRLEQMYGREIVERAQQIVVSQVINPAILAEEGVVMPVPEMWDYERNLTTEEYCEKLYKDGNGSMPTPVKIKITADGDGSGAQIGIKTQNPDLAKKLQDLLDKHGLTNLDAIDDSEYTSDGANLDAATKGIMEAVNNALKSQGKDLKSQGWMHGEALEFIESLDKPPKLVWTQRVRRMQKRFASDERVPEQKRFSRRSPVTPLPAKKGDKTAILGHRWTKYYWGDRPADRPMVLVWVDTSGSMDKQTIASIRTELVNLLKTGTIVLVGQVDAGIAREPIVFTKNNKLNEWFGRGGTDFRPAFDYLEKMPHRPNYMVYITDGMGCAPDNPPHVPVLWVLTEGGYDVSTFRKNVCTWGDAVELEIDGERGYYQY